MEHEFWQQRWEEGQIGFHQREYNRLLVKHWNSLDAERGSTVFVPMCGKSRDMLWLAENGYQVIGSELSEVAVRAFFEESEIPARRRDCPPFEQFRSENVTLYVGDHFQLTAGHLQDVSVVYDRAALVALPSSMRDDYVSHQRQALADGCVILLISLEYDPALVSPPPFSIEAGVIEDLYASWCDVEHIETIDANIKGQPGFEAGYRLTVKQCGA